MKKGVIITGAAAGIGFAIAKHLNNHGYNVYGLDINTSTEKFPGLLFTVDLLNREATKDCLNRIIKNDDLWGVVNNVAMNIPQSIFEIDFATFTKTIELNLWCAIQCSQIAANYLKQKNLPGRIVNIASTAIKGILKRSAYSSSKGAMQTLSRTLCLELAPHKITVNTVAPGAFATDLFNQLNPVGSEERRAIESNIPLGRIGDPHEIAAAVAYFLSKEASYTTGQTLYVDGGISTGIRVFKK